MPQTRMVKTQLEGLLSRMVTSLSLNGMDLSRSLLRPKFRQERSIHDFTIKNRFVFDVKYNNDAELYFGVALHYITEIAEII